MKVNNRLFLCAIQVLKKNVNNVKKYYLIAISILLRALNFLLNNIDEICRILNTYNVRKKNKDN